MQFLTGSSTLLMQVFSKLCKAVSINLGSANFYKLPIELVCSLIGWKKMSLGLALSFLLALMFQYSTHGHQNLQT
jgi:hypothetical protein